MNEIEKLNKLEDHIDEPIKKCVVGMSLLGFKPMMSCCGFSYKEEKVPKKHLEKAYLYLDYESTITNNKGTQLLQIAQKSGWIVKSIGNVFIDFYADTWTKNHPWNDTGCPHFYENFLLAITNLERALVELKSNFTTFAFIEDGNQFYKDKINKHWQYEPTQTWYVTPETFDKL